MPDAMLTAIWSGPESGPDPSDLAPALREVSATNQFGTGEPNIMRSPNGPLFKRYELIVIAAFAVAAIAVSSLGLVY